MNPHAKTVLRWWLATRMSDKQLEMLVWSGAASWTPSQLPFKIKILRWVQPSYTNKANGFPLTNHKKAME
jgi:hypothetical protein